MSEEKVLNLGSLETVVESRKPFKADINVLGGVCIGKLVKCEVVDIEHPLVKEDGTPSTYEYKGLKTPQLVLEFEQVNSDPKDDTKRYYTHKEGVIASIDKNGVPVSTKTFNDILIAMFNRLQHITNALDNANIAPLSSKIGELSIDPKDSAEVKATKFKKMFTHFATQIVGKEAIKDSSKPARYNGVNFFIKLVADYASSKFLAFPNFVGQGFIEVCLKGKGCTLQLGFNETIELVKAKGKAKGTETKDLNSNAAPAVESTDDVLKSLGLA